MLSVKKCLFWIFKRSKKSIVEQLEDIDDEILELESDRSNSMDSEKQFVFRLLFYSFIIFGLSFIIVYYYYWPRTVTGEVVVWIVFAIYPLCIYFLKYVFRMVFVRRVNKTNEKLKKLRAFKQKLLEEVMEKETYNKAQQILKRFDPLAFASISVEERKPNKSVFGSMINLSTNSEVRRRNTYDTASGDKLSTPGISKQNTIEQTITPMHGCVQTSVTSKPRLLRPLLPKERSIIDRLLDALVGDGPEKRYALICGECSSHNGMALQEEFEYLAFRCCYCNHFNPAHRTRLKSPLSLRNIGKFDPTSSQSTPCLSVKSTTGLLETMTEEMRTSTDSLNNMNDDDVVENAVVVGTLDKEDVHTTVIHDSYNSHTNGFNVSMKGDKHDDSNDAKNNNTNSPISSKHSPLNRE
ncbi:unnamed protein product [Heterobilharzia americana]|nr:unnamed protein product [Heterobilharzia americana]